MLMLNNLKQLNNQNKDLIQTLRLYPTLDKTKIAEKINVSIPTLYKAIDELKTEKVLNNSTKVNRDYGTFIGISIGTSLCKIVFLHFDFSEYSCEEFKPYRLKFLDLLDDIEVSDYNLDEDRNYVFFNTPDDFSTLKLYLNHILEGIIFFIKEETISVLSIGVSSTGTINAKSQLICQSHNLQYLEGRYIKDFIYPENLDFFNEQKIEFSLVHNSTAATIAEKFKLYEDEKNQNICYRNNLATIYLEYGISSGFIFNGKLFYGVNGHAGEIGHIFVPNKLLNEIASETDIKQFLEESNCTCGAIDCIDHIIRYFVFSGIETDFKKANSDDIYNYLSKNPNQAIRLGKILGYITNMFTKVLNVDLVIYTGKLYKSISLLEKAIQATLDDNRLRYNRADCKIHKSQIGTLAPAIGAAIYSYYQSFEIDLDWN